MASEKFYNGDVSILYIKFGSEFQPVACLTENSLSENVEELETTTVQNNGWKTSVPTNQKYNLSLSGLLINDMNISTDKISLYKLRELKRERIIFDWEIRKQLGNVEVKDYGKAFIQSISESAPVGEFISFEASLVGFGALEQINSVVGITWDGTTPTFDNTIATWDNT